MTKGLTKSRGPPLLVATTGLPALQASKTTMPKGSLREGTTTASHDLNNPLNSKPLFAPTKRTDTQANTQTEGRMRERRRGSSERRGGGKGQDLRAPLRVERLWL